MESAAGAGRSGSCAYSNSASSLCLGNCDMSRCKEGKEAKSCPRDGFEGAEGKIDGLGVVFCCLEVG